MTAIPGELLTGSETGEWAADLVRDHGRDRFAIQSAGVEPEHGAGREAVGQLDRNAVGPQLALGGAQLAQTQSYGLSTLSGSTRPCRAERISQRP